jgi:hypothetical protein
MNKHGISDGNATSGKKQWKSITLDNKLDVMKRYESTTTNAMGIPALTLRTSRKHVNKIKGSCKAQQG